jgi:hypothetical protein
MATIAKRFMLRIRGGKAVGSGRSGSLTRFGTLRPTRRRMLVDCQACGGPMEATFRFCPWCAAPARVKLVEFFPAVDDEAGRALRVSRYLSEGHVRFSVWDETGRAQAAVSIAEDEAERLAGFLSSASAANADEAPTLV